MKGDTGNRRFWIIPVQPERRKYQNWHEAIMRDRDQLWAEAVRYFREGEALYLSGEMEKQAREVQELYNDDSDDPVISLLHRFLEVPLPSDWGLKDIRQRREWLRNPDDEIMARGVEKRQRVCAVEFIVEMLGKDVGDKEIKYLSRRVSKLISRLPNWAKVSSTRHVERLYGIQRGFKRIEDSEANNI